MQRDKILQDKQVTTQLNFDLPEKSNQMFINSTLTDTDAGGGPAELAEPRARWWWTNAMAKRRHRRSFFIYWLQDTGKTTTAAAAAAHAGRSNMSTPFAGCLFLFNVYDINICVGYMHACMVVGDIDAWSTCLTCTFHQ
jgi:hypothetical protein